MTNRHVGPRLSVERLARELARTDRRLTTIETAPQLAHSSVDVDGVDYTVPDTVRIGKDAAEAAENARQFVERLDQELADARTALEEADAALQDMLADIDVDMEEHQSRIDELRNVTIPSLESDLASARQELEQADAELDERLDAAQRDLADHEDQIANLRDVTIPGVESDLADHEDQIANLRDVTVPGIADDLATARQELEQADQGLDERLDVFGGRVDAVETTASDAAAAASSAQSAADAATARADEARETAEEALRGQANLMADGMVQPSVALAGGVIRWAAYQGTDEVTLYRNGTPVERDGSGPIFSLSTDPGDVLTADGPVALWSDELRAALPPLSWASREFVIGVPANASPYQFFVYAPFSAADVTATQDDDPEAAETFKVQAGTTTVLSGKGSGKWQFVSDERVLVGWRGYGGNRSDVARPPHRYNLVYRGGGQDRVATTPDATATATSATGDGYGTNAVLLDWGEGNKGSVYPSADGSGNDMETGATPDTISDFYGLPHALSDYALMAVEPTIVRVEGWNGEEWVLRNEHDFSAASYEAPMGSQVGNPGGGGSNFTVEGPDGTDVEPSYWRLRGTGKFYARTNRGTREYAPVGFNATTYVPGTDPTGAAALRQAVQAAQDAAAAQDRAEEAHSLAGTAESNAQTAIAAAGAAQEAADSKPLLLKDTSGPTGTAPVGSVWWQVDSNSQIIGQWQRTESGWQEREIRSEVIANLDVGKLTATDATIAEAVIEKLWAEVIHARKITSDMLVVGNSSNLVDNPGLSGGSMDGWEVVSGAWTVVSSEVRNVLRTTIFNGGLIRNLRRFDCVPGDQYRFAASIRGAGSGDKIARIRWYDSDGVDLDASTELSAHGHGWTDRSTTATAPAGAFSGQLEFEVVRTGSTNYEVMFATPEIRPMTGPALIVDGAVTADKVDAESVAAAVGTFLDLSAEQITSGTIDTARLNAQEVASAVGTFLELTTDQLVAGDATIGEAVIEKLWADVIRARKITSDMLVIGGTRLIDNPIFEPDDSGSWGPGWLHPSEDSTARGTAEFYKPDDLDANAVRFMSDGENGMLINMPNTRRAAVTPGQEVRVAADVKVPDGPGVIFGINFRDRDGNLANNGSAITVPSTGNVWERFEASFVVPDDGSTTMEFVIAAILGTGSATVSISNVDMRPKTGPELIVDGAVAARHVNAESVAGAVGTFLDLSADQITSGTISADRLNAQEVAAHVGGFLEITTDQLIAGSAIISDAVAEKLISEVVEAKTITGATIRTAPSGARAELNAADGLTLYNDNNDAVFSADSNGDLEIVGNLSQVNATGRMVTGADLFGPASTSPGIRFDDASGNMTQPGGVAYGDFRSLVYDGGGGSNYGTFLVSPEISTAPGRRTVAAVTTGGFVVNSVQGTEEAGINISPAGVGLYGGGFTVGIGDDGITFNETPLQGPHWYGTLTVDQPLGTGWSAVSWYDGESTIHTDGGFSRNGTWNELVVPTRGRYQIVFHCVFPPPNAHNDSSSAMNGRGGSRLMVNGSVRVAGPSAFPVIGGYSFSSQLITTEILNPGDVISFAAIRTVVNDPKVFSGNPSNPATQVRIDYLGPVWD